MSRLRAERDLQKIHADVARLETQLLELKQKATKIAHFIEMLGVYGESSDNSDFGVLPNRGQSSNASLTVQTVVDVLRDANRPMKTRELLDILAGRGIRVGGQIPANTLSGTLSKSDFFHADRSNGWSLKTSDGGSEETEQPPADNSDDQASETNDLSKDLRL